MLRKGISPYFFMEIKMNKKEKLTPKERVVSFKKKRGYFIRSEYAHSYMLFFFGIVGTFFIETGDALNLFCRHLQNSSIMEMVMSLSVYTWIKYAFKYVGLVIGLCWMYVMFKSSDKLKGEQK